MFIKMSDGTYIPLIESGDNNVWDVDRNRRARNWASCRWIHESEEQRTRFSLTEKEILDSVNLEIDRTLQRYVDREPAFGGAPYTKEDVISDLGFFNAIKVTGHPTTSAAQFAGFFKSGLKNAVTMEELRSGLILSWYESSEDGNTSKFCTDNARDEQELSKKWAEHLAKGTTPWIGLRENAAEYAWDIARARNRKPRKEPKPRRHSYVITFKLRDSLRYLVKLTSRSVYHSNYVGEAHKYASRKTIEETAKRISRGGYAQISDIQIQEVPAIQQEWQ